MKHFVALFAFLATSICFSQSDFQRFEIIGHNASGSRVAFLLTHYGPSSKAPFVNLRIYDAELKKIVFTDSLFDLYGNEERMKVLKNELLKKTKNELLKQGITQHIAQPLGAVASDFDNQILIESDLFNGDTFFNTHIQIFKEKNANCDSKYNMTYKISVLIESHNRTIEIPRIKSDFDCGFKKVNFSNLFKIHGYIWYVLYETHEVLEGLFFREFKTYSFKLVGQQNNLRSRL